MKTGRNPKGNKWYSNQSFFRGEIDVSFREGKYTRSHGCEDFAKDQVMMPRW